MSRTSKKQRPNNDEVTSGGNSGGVPQPAIQAGICAILVILVFSVFGQTIGFHFVDFDDITNVYGTPQVTRGISLAGIAWAFTHSQLGHWDPLTTLSHMLDCQLYGLWAGGHHLTNVLLHAAAAVLLFVLLIEMTGAFWRSAFIAAAWAIHPLRVESVAWISERKDVLSGLFFMLTLLAYLAYTRQPKSKVRYCTVAALFILGLLSKSMLVTLPFVLLLLDYWPLERWQPGQGMAGWRTARRLIIEKIPLLLISMAATVAAFESARGQMISFQKAPVTQRAADALVMYLIYLKQMVWPADLAALYTRPPGGLPAGQVMLAVAVLGAVSAAIILYRRKYPWLVTGWLWYLAMLVPVAGFFQSANYPQDDRYTYLPQIGLWIAGTWQLVDWLGNWRHRNLALGSAAAVALAAMLIAAWRQTTSWADSETLWTHALACNSDNYIAHNNLGLVRRDQGNAGEAITEFQEALLINPAYAPAYNNLGNALLKQGKPVEAITEYRAALRADPNFADAHADLGNVLCLQGRVKEGIAEYRAALQIDPGRERVQNNLGSALLQDGKPEEAIACFREAVRLNPGYFQAQINLANCLFQSGDEAEGLAHLETACQLQPSNLQIENELAWVLATASQTSLRDGPRAIQLATRVSEANGGNTPIALRTLAAAYAQAGNFPNAVQTAQKALQLSQAQGNAGLANSLRQEIKLYEAGQSYAESH